MSLFSTVTDINGCFEIPTPSPKGQQESHPTPPPLPPTLPPVHYAPRNTAFHEITKLQSQRYISSYLTFIYFNAIALTVAKIM